MQMQQLEDKVLQSAYKEMWFDPHDDRQFNLVPKRLNKLIGDIQNVNLHHINYMLPDAKHRYVLYDIGPISGTTLGIEDTRYEMLNWQRLDMFAEDNEIFIHCYIRQRMLPLSTLYVKRNNKGSLLLAVQELPNRTLLRTEEKLYLRVFSNDWLQETVAGQALENPVQSYSAYVTDINETIPVLNAWRSYLPGNAFLYHNGYLVNDITAKEIALGDTLQLTVDKTGLGYKDYYIEDLSTFFSSLDGLNKLLVQLDFFTEGDVVPADEVEIYICNAQADVGVYPRLKGFYLSRIFKNDIRQITHQDIAINAQRVSALLSEHAQAMKLDKPFFRVYFRETTERKKRTPLVDGQYTLDLYMVNSTLRRQLMTGSASTNQLWKAAALEQSAYLTWQQSEAEGLSPSLVNGVYSAEELSRRLLEPEIPLQGGVGQLYYSLPPCVNIGGLALAYDGNGVLISVIRLTGVSEGGQIVVPPETVTVRTLPGSFTDDGSTFDRDTDRVDVADVYNECFYYRKVEDTAWIPAEEGVDYFTDTATGERRWSDAHVDDGRMRRSIRDSIYREWNIDPELLYYPLPIYRTTPPTVLPLSYTEVYLNGKYLVAGVDYVLAEGELTITNKMYFLDAVTEGERLNVKLLHYGLPIDSFYRQETGFIEHRRFARTPIPFLINHRHRDVWIDGCLAQPHLIAKIEDSDSVMDEGYREGGVYSLTSGLMVLSAWARARLCQGDSGEKERLSANTLANYLPEPDVSGPVFIPYAHAIYSPFIYRIIQMVRGGAINVAKVGHSRAAVAQAITPHLDARNEDIISYDLDWDMINVHPCPANEQMTITEDEYQFLITANEVYFHNRLEFNSYFNITQ